MPDRGHLDELLDQALAGTFPASDPVSTLACVGEAPSALPAAEDEEQGARGDRAD